MDYTHLTKKNIFIVGVMVVALSLLANYLYSTSFWQTGFVIAEPCPTVRPFFGSINCVKDQTATQFKILPGQTFSCTTDDHECRLISLDNAHKMPDCGGVGGLYLPFGMNVVDLSTNTPVWECSVGSWTNEALLSCIQRMPQYDLNRGHMYKYNVWCNTLSGPAPPYNIDDYLLNFRSFGEHFEIRMDAGVVPMTGAHTGCKKDKSWNAYYGKQPERTVVDKIRIAAESVWGVPLLTQTLMHDAPADSTAGQAYWMVYDWVVRPDLILSRKNNQLVWCDATSNSLVLVERIRSVTGQCYQTPTAKLGSVECCNSAYCQVKYNDPSYTCDAQWSATHEPTFTCVKGGIPCSSDYQCGASAPVCRFVNGKHMLTSVACISGQCQTQTKEVPCCTGNDGGPFTCGFIGGGLFCDYDKGCTPLTQACPTGMCCKPPKYIETGCPPGKICCTLPNDPYLGQCLDSCVGPIGCDSTCKSQGYGEGSCINIVGDQCQGKSLGAVAGCSFYETCCCTSPGLGTTWPWLWMIILAFVGFLFGKHFFFDKKDEDVKKKYSIALALVLGVFPLLLYFAGVDLPDIQTPLATCTTDQGVFGGIVSWLVKVLGGVDTATVIFYISIVFAVLSMLVTMRIMKDYSHYINEKFVPIVTILAGIITYKLVCSFFWIGVIIILLYILYIIIKTVGPSLVGAAVKGVVPWKMKK